MIDAEGRSPDARVDIPQESNTNVTPPESGSARGWWPIAWYPVAAPVAFVVAVWAASFIHPGWLVRPVLVIVAVVLLLTLAISILLNDRHRGALAAAVVALALLVVDERIRTGLLIVALIVIGEGLLRRGRPWRFGRLVTRFCSVLGAVLLVVTLVGTAQYGVLQGAIEDVAADLNTRRADEFTPSAPDIYVVLLDGYPGDDGATLDPTFDAESFPTALAARGFDVERHARANYLTTRLTVPTMLAAQHVDAAPELDPPFGSQAFDARRLRNFGDDGVVLRTLRDAGYETITATSPAAHLGLRRVDRVIDPFGPNEFERVLLEDIAIGSIIDDLAPDFFAGLAREQLLSTFSAAEAVAAEPHTRPRFVWIHVMAPHPPFLFRADASPVLNAPVLDDAVDKTAPGFREARIRDTFDYADFVAGRTEQMLDRLIASATRESVLVIFSDHGTETAFEASDPLASDLNERTSVVLAVRSPGHPGLLPPGTTPIGVLPRVLNAYLGTSLPIRADTSYGWPKNGSLLDSVPIDPGTFAR